jgi:hypothetical protein
MADFLTLLNKRNDKINVFVTPTGMMPLPNAGAPDKRYLWSFHTKHPMQTGLYEGIILSAADKLTAYARFLEVLRPNTDHTYHYEGVQWYSTCEGEDNYPERQHAVLIAAKATD